MGIQVFQATRAIQGLAELGDFVRVDPDSGSVMLVRELGDAVFPCIVAALTQGALRPADAPAPERQVMGAPPGPGARPRPRPPRPGHLSLVE